MEGLLLVSKCPDVLMNRVYCKDVGKLIGINSLKPSDAYMHQ